MRTPGRYTLFLGLLLLTVFSTDKDLNEYGKWLKFYGLKDEDFKQTGTGHSIKSDWKEYDLPGKDKKLYNSLYFYSPDSTYFLDLYSYSVILDKDAKGNLTWSAGDPESKAQLVKTKSLSASTLLFFGTTGFFETALWENEYIFEIYGFTIDDNKYIPTTWKYDLNRMTEKVFRSKRIFKIRPKSYLQAVRLKRIKMI